MNEEQLQRIFQKGYIPENLPKVFSSISFGPIFNDIEPLILATRATMPYKYDVYKKKYATRQFTLLNPYNFAQLARELKDDWSDIQETLDGSNISFTKIVFGEKDNESNALVHSSKARFREAIFTGSIGMSALVTCDIVEHYDSTYTHSVAWAMHGKDYIKGLMRQGRRDAINELSGSKIDRAIRNGDEQQTNGIPTGPETSRIVSEVILSAIDVELIRLLKEAEVEFVGGRYVDDYELYFVSVQDANTALELLRQVLGKFRYRISELKTHIVSGPPIPVDEKWKQELRGITPNELIGVDESYSVDSSQLDFKRITYFIKDSVTLTRAYDDHRIIKNVLSYNLRKYKCDEDDCWPIYEVYLLQLLSNYPNTVKAVIDIIQNHEKGTSENVAKVLNHLLSKRNLSIFDAIWLLYGCLVFEIRLTKLAINNIQKINDPILWLMLLSLQKTSLADVDSYVFENAWNGYSLDDEGWLFKYEAVAKGWIGDAAGIVATDSFFGKLLEKEASFYITVTEDIELDEDDWFNPYEDIDFSTWQTTVLDIDKFFKLF